MNGALVIRRAEMLELPRIRARPTAHNDHHVDFARQLDGAQLPVAHGATDRVNDLHLLGHADQLGDDFLAQLERMRRLEDDADLAQQPLVQLGPAQLIDTIHHERRVLESAEDPLDFSVVPVPDDDDLTAA